MPMYEEYHDTDYWVDKLLHTTDRGEIRTILEEAQREAIERHMDDMHDPFED